MSEAIRNEFIEQWTRAAKADKGAWLREVLEQPEANLNALIVSMTSALGFIEVEEPDADDPDWDPNFLLNWQTYGTDPAEEGLTTVRFHGADHVVFFAEYDAFEACDLAGLVAQGSFDRIVIEMPDGVEADEIVDAAGFVEDSMGVGSPIDPFGGFALPWSGDATRFETTIG